MSTCKREGTTYNRHDYRKNPLKCEQCGHNKPMPKLKDKGLATK